VSILTIGFICEQLKAFNFSFEEKQQETILTGILVALRDSHPDIVEIAFKALRDGLPAMNGIIKSQECRVYLISQLVDAIERKSFVDYSIQGLEEFIKCYFSLLEPNYVTILANCISKIMANPQEESSCIVAMDFWAVFAREEKNIESNPNLNKFITGPLSEQLVQVLLQNLCFIEDEDEEANGVSEAAAAALEAIFEGNSVDHEKTILSFTENTIHDGNWKVRQASIRAFALLLLGLPQERSQELVNNSLLQLASLLNDPVQYVQLSALKSLTLISEEVPEVILHHEQFLKLLEFVVKMGQSELFLKHVTKIVDHLTNA
jgi:hypothetical protein